MNEEINDECRVVFPLSQFHLNKLKASTQIASIKLQTSAHMHTCTLSELWVIFVSECMSDV